MGVHVDVTSYTRHAQRDHVKTKEKGDETATATATQRETRDAHKKSELETKRTRYSDRKRERKPFCVCLSSVRVLHSGIEHVEASSASQPNHFNHSIYIFKPLNIHILL